MFSFSSEEGRRLFANYSLIDDLWPHTPRDYQLEAVTKALDGTGVLALLLTGAGKTAILVILYLF